MANEGLLIERCIVGAQEVISYSVDAVVVQLTVVLDGRVEAVVQFGIAGETDVLLRWN